MGKLRMIIENYMCPECKDADDIHICKNCDIVDRQEEDIKKEIPKKYETQGVTFIDKNEAYHAKGYNKAIDEINEKLF